MLQIQFTIVLSQAPNLLYVFCDQPLYHTSNEVFKSNLQRQFPTLSRNPSLQVLCVSLWMVRSRFCQLENGMPKPFLHNLLFETTNAVEGLSHLTTRHPNSVTNTLNRLEVIVVLGDVRWTFSGLRSFPKRSTWILGELLFHSVLLGNLYTVLGCREYLNAPSLCLALEGAMYVCLQFNFWAGKESDW